MDTAFIFGAILVALAATLSFRFGRLRQLASLYRSPDLPPLWRNAPLVGPIAVAGFVPIAVLGAFGGPIAAMPSRSAQGAIVIGLLALAMLIFGSTALVAARPPRWFLPRWLRDEDDRLGFVPHRADRGLTGFGVLVIAIATVGLGYAISLLLRTA